MFSYDKWIDPGINGINKDPPHNGSHKISIQLHASSSSIGTKITLSTLVRVIVRNEKILMILK